MRRDIQKLLGSAIAIMHGDLNQGWDLPNNDHIHKKPNRPRTKKSKEVLKNRAKNRAARRARKR